MSTNCPRAIKRLSKRYQEVHNMQEIWKVCRAKLICKQYSNFTSFQAKDISGEAYRLRSGEAYRLRKKDIKQTVIEQAKGAEQHNKKQHKAKILKTVT